MRELINTVGSIHHLASFQAAATELSFTKAADDLGVSQPAISQSIRKLEDSLGFKLFNRLHRKLELTQAGLALANEVNNGFSKILGQIKTQQKNQTKTPVTLSLSTAFANYWILPKMQHFYDQHPSIEFRLQASDKDLDLAEEGITFAIRVGDGKWPGYQALKLADENISVVASPAWVATHPPLSSLQALAAEPLIHLAEPHRQTLSWQNWFDALGAVFIDHRERSVMHDYALVLQAAIAGQGLAMGQGLVCDDLIDKGLLCKLGSWQWATGRGIYLLCADHGELSAQAQQVQQWIADIVPVNEPQRPVCTETSFDFSML